MAGDLVIGLASFYVAALAMRVPGIPWPGALLAARIQIVNLLQVSALLVVWHLSFTMVGLYHSRRLSTMLSESIDVLKAVAIGVGTVYALDKVLRIAVLTPRVGLGIWATACIACIFARLSMRLLVRQARLRGRNLRHLLVVGTNNRALDLAAKIQERASLGFNLLGFVDNPDEVRQAFVDSGSALVTSFSDFGSYISTHVVDEVIICLPLQSYYQQCSRLANLCHEQGIIVRVSSDIFDLQLPTARTDKFDGDPMVTISAGGMQGWPAVVKNLLDRAISAVALIALSPLLLITALAVKFSSNGPALYVQERFGLNKRRFKLYKFRTMMVDAEIRQKDLEAMNEAEGPVFKIRNDPRITPIGRFLRKYSIDELPQLVNVLKGDMSLVGPRPLPVRDCVGFSTSWHRRRFSVRPGLSCLWQVSGRSSLGFEDWMRLDMQYIDQWSLWLDMKIIAKTVRVVLTGAGAW
jgi:exopolysaccharide biosynthesis polyprenyl glycosylphosphotransferase